ncbi:ATP-binding protein [Mesorhizobium sp. M0848]|uniref:ATP-binding protein n=1 Tax=Mesorhizobium sp. M0848 TaxID=2957012 RepID=UPI003336E098
MIGSPRLAVFELVKNAYDADASEVVVRISGLDEGDPTITVEDDGYGMSFETIRDIWLVPADDHRELERADEIRSPKFNRLPLGEKGVGRFAVHKLGDRIELVTRAARKRECVVKIDWRDMMRSRLLDEAKVTVKEREPAVFTKSRTGTRITISSLREPDWTRRDLRDLWRQLTSIASPFGQRKDKFDIKLEVPERKAWLEDLPDVTTLLEEAPWRFSFSFNGRELTYAYEFIGVPGIAVEPRTVTRSEPLQIWRESQPDDLDPGEKRSRRRVEKVTADPGTIRGIGPFSGTFYVYDRDRDTLSRYANRRLIERFLDQNGGVRVYRDTIRVYNYGEADDDWLGLDIRRVNSPTKNISRNIIIGAIDLRLETSGLLKEKTNREGFVINDAYHRLRQMVVGALAVLEADRQIDKRKMRLATGKATAGPQGITKPIEQLRRTARQHGVAEQMEPSIRRIEKDYEELRENFLRAGLSNVGLAVVFHEVERGVAMLHRTILSGGSLEQVRTQSGQLQGVLEQSTRLLRKNERAVHSLRDLVVSARDLLLVRLRHHQIQLTCPVLENELGQVRAVFAFNLALGALTNLIDNAIYWLQVAHPDESAAVRRRLYLNVVADWDGRPAVIVADNGTGFTDAPDEVVQPFFSRRPDGMGLGLYYTNMVMQLNDGRLELPANGDADIPAEFTGAVAVLLFKGVD